MKAEEAVQEWRRGLGFGSLRARILAVNLLAVIVLATPLWADCSEWLLIWLLPTITLPLHAGWVNAL